MSTQDPCTNEWEQYQRAMKEREMAQSEANTLNAGRVEQGGATPPASKLDVMRAAFKRLHEAEENEKEKMNLWMECQKKNRIIK